MSVLQVAHQWFGNLVTCRDFEQLTVNEGMASFMEYLCVQAVLPQASAAALRRRATSPMSERLTFPNQEAAQELDCGSSVENLCSSGALMESKNGLMYSRGLNIKNTAAG